ncbi:diguanylate cyclase domain-containing protein [Carnobacterium sp. TMP28]|uniref:diguanylate cyclase domain-containing protein n=1 Tax=Carnobacterium sp. TMP28 TaxID=3397060 RepID=UPI0039DFBC37
MVSIYEGFFLNLCVLIASLFVYKQLVRNISESYENKYSSIISGSLGGLLGIILMHFSIVTGVNSIIDLRVIPLMLTILYNGWLSSSITAIVIIISRFMIGVNSQSLSNVVFILLSWAIFYFCSKKIKNRWTSVVVMLSLSNAVYTLLTILVPSTTSINYILLVNYWTVSILGGLVAVYIMDYLTKSEFLFKQHKSFAFTDPLTGLNNVRSFDRAFNRAKKRQDKSIAIMILDIDRFKQVNDTYGHLEGDVVLRKLAAILKMSQGPEDIVSRNGGEEFSILIHNCTKSEAYEKAESIRKIVENSFFIIKNGTMSLHITISVGMTIYSDTTKEIDHLYAHADQALYEAKKSGRNKVCFYSGDNPLS